MESSQIAIYGAGGFAREVAWLIEACSSPSVPLEVVCFVDDDVANQGKRVNGTPILGLTEAKKRFPMAKIVGGVGAPKTREILMNKASAAGFGFATLVHPRVEQSRWIEIGPGTVIGAGSILTTNISLGQHVQINLDCTVGHDVIMADYATLAPGAHVSGCVHLGRRVYVGTGATIINGTQQTPVVVGDDAVVGAGACVTRSVAAGLTVVGVPARPINA